MESLKQSAKSNTNPRDSVLTVGSSHLEGLETIAMPPPRPTKCRRQSPRINVLEALPR